MTTSKDKNVITTSVGPIELEIHGSGIPVLILHGSPGGIDAARTMARFLPPATFQTVCVSRPGYFETPLDPHVASIDHEADLLAAALSAVGVERAGILAWSGGGPAAYRLAARHPYRIRAIVAIAAVSKRYVAPAPNLQQRLLFGTGLGERVVAALGKHVPDHLVEEALASEGSIRGEALRTLAEQVKADPEQRRVVLEMAQTTNIAGKRKAGWYNDEANFARIDSLRLEHVKCPVLLVHGDSDVELPLEASRFAHETLPRSTLVEMKHGTHFALYAHPDGAKLQEQARRWLVEHA